MIGLAKVIIGVLAVIMLARAPGGQMRTLHRRSKTGSTSTTGFKPGQITWPSPLIAAPR